MRVLRRRATASSIIRASLVLVLLATEGPSRAQPNDHAALAQRFRPYYKFSTETLFGQERTRPCSWEWFVAHSELRLGSQLYLTNSQLQQDPRRILQQNNSDVRRSAKKDKPFTLHPSGAAHEGQPWTAVVNDGAGLYAQVEESEGGQVVIVYWTLYAYNLGTGGVAFEHEGDITAVAVVYERARDQLVRASFVLHGPVLESFDLQGPESRRIETLRGVTANGAPEMVQSEVLRIAPNRRYQDGPSWHSPARPSDVYLVKDPRTGKFEHLTLFIEWGAHEVWPNPNGSVIAAPKHNGEGVSFLPTRVRFAGSTSAIVEAEAPFFFFNGVWGDPPSPVFHRICFDPKGPSRPTVGIPDDQMTDRDPYWTGGLPWPPPRVSGPTRARVVVSCAGDRNDAQIALRWGHPDFHNNEYFPLWTIKRGQTLERTFNLPDRNSEFEVQTEGGEGTAYTISIWVDDGNGMPAQPSIVLKHNVGGIRDEHVVANNVSASRSSGLNKYGEQNIRVDTAGRVAGPIR
jgi:hypothetical protein